MLSHAGHRVRPLPRQGSRSRATSAVKAVASVDVSGPGTDGSARSSTAAIGCTSRVVDVRNASSASCSAPTGVAVSRISMPSSRGELQHQRARHAEQAARRTRRRDRHAVAHHEHVGAGGLAQLVARVGEHRFARAALVRVRERPHVLGVRRGLQPRGRAAVVAHPRHHDDVDRRRPRSYRAARDDDRRARVAALRTERRHPTGDRDPQARLLVQRSRRARRRPPRAARRDRGPRARARRRSARGGRGGGSTRTADRRTRGWSRTRRRRRAARGRRATRVLRPRRPACRRPTPTSGPVTTRPGRRCRRRRGAGGGSPSARSRPTRRRAANRRRCRRPPPGGCHRARRRPAR